MSFFQNGNLIENLTATATAAGTTTLTVSSKSIQIFTGSANQTIKLPVATTLVNGQKYEIVNTSTGILTLQYQDASAFSTATLSAGSSLILRLTDNSTANGVWAAETFGSSASPLPTIQKFTTGSGTYITPAGVSYIRVRMVGGGGGGGGNASGAGTGGTTTFGTTLLSGNGGSGGNGGGSSATGGTGGTASLGTGPIGTAATGSGGQGGQGGITTGAAGGMGGNSPFSGAGGTVGNGAGTAAAANSGSGGGGAGTGGGTGPCGGGASGGYVDAIIKTPLATYAYAVGASGTAGTGTNAGGAGGSGYIEVTEYYGSISLTAATSSIPVYPTVQRFTSGSGTYTTPAGVLYVKVRMVGGGGGGSGSGSGAGSATGSGTASTFGTSLLSAGGGVGAGTVTAAPGLGGSSSLGTGPIGTALTGGGGATGTASTVVQAEIGGIGGSSAFGGAGITTYNAVGGAGATNTGGGGGGGSSAAGANQNGGNGGGGGGFVDAIIANPLSTYTYTVGAGGSAGGAGTGGNAGGAGAAGYIEVTEYYQNYSVGTTTSVAQNAFLAGPTSGSGNPTFRSLVLSDLSGMTGSSFNFAAITPSSGVNTNSASGTQTITLAGTGTFKWKVTVNIKVTHNNAYTASRATWTLGGTATRTDPMGNAMMVDGIEAQDADDYASLVIYGTATNSQTVTVALAYQCNFSIGTHTAVGGYLMEYLP